MKNYLEDEEARNKRHSKLYERLVQKAFGNGKDVIIAHHVVFQSHGDVSTVNEIPSADTVLFDHEIMGRVFGEGKTFLMRRLADLGPDTREALVEATLDELDLAA